MNVYRAYILMQSEDPHVQFYGVVDVPAMVDEESAFRALGCEIDYTMQLMESLSETPRWGRWRKIKMWWKPRIRPDTTTARIWWPGAALDDSRVLEAPEWLKACAGLVLNAHP